LLNVIIGGESLVSHAGGALLVETARRTGLARQLSRLLGPWRKPLAVHDPGKIVLDLAVAVALGGDAACDVGVLRAQPGCSDRWPRTRRVTRSPSEVASGRPFTHACASPGRMIATGRSPNVG
jgi:hypothetical protein